MAPNFFLGFTAFSALIQPAPSVLRSSPFL